MNKCKFCDSNSNDFISLNDTIDYSGIEIAINSQGMLRSRYYDIDYDSNFRSQDIINIKYCPMCGKELVK